MLREYLYIDERRLNSYFDQVSIPVARDKVSSWKVALGITGPRAEASQSTRDRPFTTEEKLDKFLDAIREAEIVGVGQHAEYSPPYGTEFRMESLEAKRVCLQSPGLTQDDKLFLWVAGQTEGLCRGHRCGPTTVLIEDYRGADNGSWRWLSGYSALIMLLEELNAHQESSDAEHSSRGSLGLGHALGPELLSTLEKGFRLASSRRVECVYRYRASCWNGRSGQEAVVTVGYPIAIWE